MHREILKKYGFKIKNMETDHKNLNRLDNRKNNLRVATRQQNQANKYISKRNTSGVKGAYWNKNSKRWLVYLSFNNVKQYLGGFLNLKDAKKAYIEGARKYFGEFANG